MAKRDFKSSHMTAPEIIFEDSQGQNIKAIPAYRKRTTKH